MFWLRGFVALEMDCYIVVVVVVVAGFTET